MPRLNTFWRRALGLAGFMAVLGVWVWIEAIPAPAVAPSAGQAITIDKSPGAQADRRRVIEKLLADGLVRRINPQRGGEVDVSIRPQFVALDEATRRSYAEVVYRYHFDGSNVNDAVILRDARHGNEVGRYNPYQGGLILHKVM
jgi:hypothetical protein